MKTLKRINLLRFEQEEMVKNEKKVLVGGRADCSCGCACGYTCSCSYVRLAEAAFNADVNTSAVSNNGLGAIQDQAEGNALNVGKQTP
ncbi:rSAM-modified peptide [Bacteroidales bacterium SW292]|nr:rSAM-modified peptide [Bacteroidales bacterium SW292]